jgi:hypothetical protein
VRALVGALTLAIAGALASPAAAQTDPFAFIPAGGKTLLLRVIATAPPRAEVILLLSSKRSPADWKIYLKSRAQAMPAVRAMNDSQLTTLASYLSLVAPMKEGDLPKGTDAAAWIRVLPPDGRDLVLTKCQNCHIITVVVTQEKDPRGWRGLLQTPNHAKLLGGAAQEEMLGQYLAVIAPIPIEQIPPPLRAGGASY